METGGWVGGSFGPLSIVRVFRGEFMFESGSAFPC